MGECDDFDGDHEVCELLDWVIYKTIISVNTINYFVIWSNLQ
jgi:hypothetical protein